MISKTYKFQAKCDLCETEEVFEAAEENYWPDGWFELRNNGAPVELSNGEGERITVTVAPLHFCLDCFDKLFGVGGSVWGANADADTDADAGIDDDDDLASYVGLTD